MWGHWCREFTDLCSITRRQNFHCPPSLPPHSSLHQPDFYTLGPFGFGFLFLSLFLLLLQVQKGRLWLWYMKCSSESWTLLPKEDKESSEDEFPDRKRLTTSQFFKSHNGFNFKWLVLCFRGWAVVPVRAPVDKARHISTCVTSRGGHVY